MKKFLAIVLAMIMVLAMVACSSSDKPAAAPASSSDSTAAKTESAAKEEAAPAATEEPAAEKKSYQLVGKYEEEGENAARLNAAFKVDLNEDGTVVADRYRYLAGEYDDNFMTGTWQETEKDGIECIQIDMACTAEDGTKANEQTVYAYEMAGEYSVEISFPIIVGMQYQRSLSITGSAEKAYADDEAFKADYAVEAPAAEPAAEEPAAEEPAAEEPAAEAAEKAVIARYEGEAFGGMVKLVAEMYDDGTILICADKGEGPIELSKGTYEGQGLPTITLDKGTAEVQATSADDVKLIYVNDIGTGAEDTYELAMVAAE